MNFRERMRKINEINLEIIELSKMRTTEDRRALILIHAGRIEGLSIEDPRNCDTCGSAIGVSTSYRDEGPCVQFGHCRTCNQTISGRDWDGRREYILKWLEGQKERCLRG